MFPTFISILDIQSWWEVPSIAHFCSLFRTAFNLLDFDIEDLEEALLTDGTEETSWLQELIVRLLSGCLPNNEISTFNYQMFLRRLFRQKCQEYDLYNPFNTDIDFQLLPLRTKVDILHTLCDFRLDADDVLDQLKNLEADSLRVEPLGTDDNRSAYWYFYGTRLYREDFVGKGKSSSKKGKSSVWQVICFTEHDWFQLAKKFEETTSKAERQLFRTLNENFLPELPRLFREKERLARKRLLENQPRRTSSRLRKQESPVVVVEDEPKPVDKEDVERNRRHAEEKERLKRRQELQDRRREAYERRSKLRDEEEEEEEDSHSDTTDDRYEMAKSREKKTNNNNNNSKTRHRKVSHSTAHSNKDVATRSASNRNNGKTLGGTKSASAAVSTTAVGRQTNNSLACATGQIVIQPVTNTNHKKKLKTSQVFRQTDEDLQTGMYKILEYVKGHEDAWPFVDPVDEDYAPNYYTVVRKPMDLQRMEDRLDGGHYKTYSKFKADFQLIVDNCRLYNGAENEYTEMVGNLVHAFERATERYLDQITSSDEEIAVEFPEGKGGTKRRKTMTTSTKRKPMLAAQIDKRRRSESIDTEVADEKDKEEQQQETVQHKKQQKPIKKEVPNKMETKSKSTVTKRNKSPKERKEAEGKKKTTAKSRNNSRKTKVRSTNSGRSRSRSKSKRSLERDAGSPKPTLMLSSSPEPDSFEIKKRKKESGDDNKRKKKTYQTDDEGPEQSAKKKTDSKWDDLFRPTNEVDKGKEDPPLLATKDKHNKLRETIEKLKAKSEIADDSGGGSKEYKRGDNIETSTKKQPSRDRPVNKKTKSKEDRRVRQQQQRKSDVDGSNNSKAKTNNNNSNNNNKNNTNIDDLTLATEQTLKDINKWLDGASPKSCDDVVASPKRRDHSPSSHQHPQVGTGGDKNETAMEKKKAEKQATSLTNNKPSLTNKEVHSIAKKKGAAAGTTGARDPRFKRREVQRTIDRLQPGKSKGNLLSNVQAAAVGSTEESGSTSGSSPFMPLLLGPLAKIKDAKNSLIVKTDDDAPKLSLGSVLDSFGKHEFVDNDVEEEMKKMKQQEPIGDGKMQTNKETDEGEVVKKSNEKSGGTTVTEKKSDAIDKTATEEKKSFGGGNSPGKATPNLSAWFKAFGVSKVQSLQKKTDKSNEVRPSTAVATSTAGASTTMTPLLSSTCSDSVKDDRKPTEMMSSPSNNNNPDSPSIHGQTMARQRKISTGSSVSERSSFSQDMDSPRVGIEERLLGAYPAPYPSPLHRSPSSGASPVMASPRPDCSPKGAAYPSFNGQIRVGFYQDTVSTKSSPEKSCSPRDNPQSPYAQYSEHVYAPQSGTGDNGAPQPTYSAYGTPGYYAHASSYPATTPPQSTYNNPPPEPYYDTGRPSKASVISESGYQNGTTTTTTIAAGQPVDSSNKDKQNLQQPTPPYHQHHHNQMFPVKKRAYNGESEQYDYGVDGTVDRTKDGLLRTSSPGDRQAFHEPTQQERTTVGLNANLLSPQNLTTCQTASSIESSHLAVQQQTNQIQQPHPQQQSQHIHQQHQMQASPANGQAKYGTSDTVSGPTTDTRQPQELDYSGTTTTSAYNSYDYGIGRPLSTLEHEKYPGSTEYETTAMPYNLENTAHHQYNNRQEVNYSRVNIEPPTTTTTASTSSAAPLMRYGDGITNTAMESVAAYKSANVHHLHHQNVAVQQLSPRDVAQIDYKSTSADYAKMVAPPTVIADNNRLDYKEMTLTRPPYGGAQTLSSSSSTSGTIDMTNLTHIADRYATPDQQRMLTPSSAYYDKNLLYPSKPMMTTTTGAAGAPGATTLQMYGQPGVTIPYELPPYGNRPIEMQNVVGGMEKPPMQQQQQLAVPAPPEKKTKRRKTAKNSNNAGSSAQVPSTSTVASLQLPASSSNNNSSSNRHNHHLHHHQQGFQTYVGLKTSPTSSQIEPGAISLKTASVVPGSAFNFGPTPTALGLGAATGLYGASDKDTATAYHPNFLDDLRSTAPNYYMAAAAAAAQQQQQQQQQPHHLHQHQQLHQQAQQQQMHPNNNNRTTPDGNADKLSRGHGSSGSNATLTLSQQQQQQGPPPPSSTSSPSYSFIGAPQPRAPPAYPLGGHFMPSPHQGPAPPPPLMDTSSPLYRQYLQAGMLQQSLLAPAGTYHHHAPPGYHHHHLTSMRQPFDTRPPWL